MTKLKNLKKRFMEDPEFREEYARIDEEYALIEALVRARTAAKLTQAELARRLGTAQSAVARLEGGRVSPSLATLRRGNRHAVDGGSRPGRRLRRASPGRQTVSIRETLRPVAALPRVGGAVRAGAGPIAPAMTAATLDAAQSGIGISFAFLGT